MDKLTFDAIVVLLIPQMSTEAVRRAFVTQALWDAPNLMNRITYEGSAKQFTINLLSECTRFGQIAPGRMAVIALLEQARGSVGIDDQQRIDNLIAQIARAALEENEPRASESKQDTIPTHAKNEQKTVFISYRRMLSKHLARSIYLDLKMNGWDVFLDVNTIDSGDFDRIILDQISARAHFILLISPNSLERCLNHDDWVRREIEEAVRLERNIIPVFEEGVDLKREMGFLPIEVRAVLEKKNGLPLPHYFFDAAMEMLRNRFLKTPQYIETIVTPQEDRAEVQRRMGVLDAEITVQAPSAQVNSLSANFLPKSFEWIDIPGKNFSIAKYPVTNEHFAKFLEAEGYNNREWWTDAGWTAKNLGWDWNSSGRKWEPTGNIWSQPRHWDDIEFNHTLQPVVGVSWYEAVAFCLWLSKATSQSIMLPTEDEWQFAAQGEDGRIFPWGNDWDCRRCSNSVDPCSRRTTTPVTTHEGIGNSPFGVVDMIGNAWEWCLTDYDTRENSIHTDAKNRVMRGGAWSYDNADYFRVVHRDWYEPHIRDNYIGFRIALTHEQHKEST